MQRIFRLLFFIFTLLPAIVFAQKNAVLTGTIVDEKNVAIPFVNVILLNAEKTTGVVSDPLGRFTLNIPKGKAIIQYSFTGYETRVDTLFTEAEKTYKVNITLRQRTTDLPAANIYGKDARRQAFTTVSIQNITQLPTISGGVEDIIKSLPGVSSNNELSSQYSVRGGNYDENLVYVNDIEIYRSQLIRSGEQEGLSFVNPDLVSSVQFSSGGFNAKYGDKMSSVLDIQYKQPTSFGGSFAIDLMGGSLHLEGCSKDRKFKFLIGARQKFNQYMLGTLDTKGEYKPSYTDIQTYLAYQFHPNYELSFLGNLSRNVFDLTPTDRSTRLGTSSNPKEFRAFFEGQERDQFNTYLGALCLKHNYDDHFFDKLSISAFYTVESENYDILEEYLLQDAGSSDASTPLGLEAGLTGVGSNLNHARNNFNAIVLNIDYKASLEVGNSLWQWGLGYSHDDMIDHLNEWKMVDSSGYSLPTSPNQPGNNDVVPTSPQLQESVLADHYLKSNRFNAFGQNTYSFGKLSNPWVLNAGIRFSYWDYNHEFLSSPRVSLRFTPTDNKDLSFRIATGVYYQQPFYREYRYPNGSLNPDIKSQQSIHIVGASDWKFRTQSGKPFVLTTEVYYKILNDLIPYQVDNVRIRYMAENCSKGYAAGIDFRLNGEFVPGAESWISLSFMTTKENITYTNSAGQEVSTGYIPRPTDQAVSLNLYWQDYLPGYERFKVFLNAVFASGLPVGLPDAIIYPENFASRETFKLPAYKRVDIGFSYLLKSQKDTYRKGNPLGYCKEIWLGLDAFNIFDFNNTISYQWIKDISGTQYAIPNYLTSRRWNVRLSITF